MVFAGCFCPNDLIDRVWEVCVGVGRIKAGARGVGVCVGFEVVGWFSRRRSCHRGLVVFAGCFCPYD